MLDLGFRRPVMGMAFLRCIKHRTVANHKVREQKLAQELYLLTSKTQKEIAEDVGVAVQTVCGWVDAGKWETLRAGRLSTPSAVVANLLEIQKVRTEQMLEEMRNGGTNKFGDELLKISMVIEKLQGQTSLATYIQVFQELMGFVRGEDHQFRAKLADYQSTFLTLKAGTNG